jgi:hypothetical protein
VADAAGDALLAAVHRRGLTVPFRLLLDAHLPLAPLLSDAAAFAAPMFQSLGLGELSVLLADPARTAERLDALAAAAVGGPPGDACPTRES